MRTDLSLSAAIRLPFALTVAPLETVNEISRHAIDGTGCKPAHATANRSRRSRLLPSYASDTRLQSSSCVLFTGVLCSSGPLPVRTVRLRGHERLSAGTCNSTLSVCGTSCAISCVELLPAEIPSIVARPRLLRTSRPSAGGLQVWPVRESQRCHRQVLSAVRNQAFLQKARAPGMCPWGSFSYRPVENADHSSSTQAARTSSSSSTIVSSRLICCHSSSVSSMAMRCAPTAPAKTQSYTLVTRAP